MKMYFRPASPPMKSGQGQDLGNIPLSGLDTSFRWYDGTGIFGVIYRTGWTRPPGGQGISGCLKSGGTFSFVPQSQVIVR